MHKQMKVWLVECCIVKVEWIINWFYFLVYTDETALIAKNTSLIVARVPVAGATNKKIWYASFNPYIADIQMLDYCELYIWNICLQWDILAQTKLLMVIALIQFFFLTGIEVNLL